MNDAKIIMFYEVGLWDVAFAMAPPGLFIIQSFIR